MNNLKGAKVLQRVERHVVNKNDITYKAIDTLCGKSKNLYNYVNYIIRQSFIADSTIPGEYDLVKQFHDKHDEVYYDMCGNTNQQCIKLLYKNWKSFFRAVKDYSKNPSKYLGRPRLPGYKNKSGKNIVIFTYSDSRIKSGYLYVNHKAGIGPIRTVVVGHNKNWKQETNTGKVNNQKFVSIPYNKFIQQLQYKGEDVNIQVIVIEESYTSKIDHLALEPMQKQDNYMGKRIYRGLFKSSTGKAINADLNGAVGILRKVIDESQFVEIINRGFVTNPVKVNPLAKIFI